MSDPSITNQSTKSKSVVSLHREMHVALSHKVELMFQLNGTEKSLTPAGRGVVTRLIF